MGRVNGNSRRGTPGLTRGGDGVCVAAPPRVLPSHYQDGYEAPLLKLVEARQGKSKPTRTNPKPEQNNVVDLMVALKAPAGGASKPSDRRTHPRESAHLAAELPPRRRVSHAAAYPDRHEIGSGRVHTVIGLGYGISESGSATLPPGRARER